MKKVLNNLLLLIAVLFTAVIMLSVAKENKSKAMGVLHNGCQSVEHVSACWEGGLGKPRRQTCKTMPCQ